MNKLTISSPTIFLVYFVFSFSTLLIWNGNEKYQVIGDEPFYLMIAGGIAKHGVLEQTVPFKEEAESKYIYKPGIAPLEATPSPVKTHAVLGPHGFFSVHNVGLPLLISLPFLFAGTIGAKIMMIFANGMVVFVAWRISGIFSAAIKDRFFAVLAVCVALPFIPAAAQIYPDILAGVLALSGIYWFMTANRRRLPLHEGFWIGAIVFLPWLQIKFAAACVTLVVSLALKIYVETKDIKRVSMICGVAAFSAVALCGYNYYAFGSIFGPYDAGAVQFSKTAVMVLVGLLIDQNQGFLLQSPIMFVGLFSIGALFSYSRTVALLWLMVFLALVVPNGLHPVWYGGLSFSGRFGWSGAVVFILPTVYGLIDISKKNSRLFKSIIGVSCILQAYFFYRYFYGGVDLYNKFSPTFFNSYSLFYFPIYPWLPALYNADWAFRYWPNFGWLIVIFLICAAGFAASRQIGRRSRQSGFVLLIACFAIILASGSFGKAGKQDAVFMGGDLPSQSGRVEGAARVVMEGTDLPGFVTFGPYFPLRRGAYRLKIRYSSLAPIEKTIGHWDVRDAVQGIQIVESSTPGTAGEIKTVEASFKIHNADAHPFEFRNYWNGSSGLEILSIELELL